MNRSTCLPAAALIAAACAAPGAALAAEPTALESFVANPNAVIAFSVRVGEIRSTDATLAITALVVEDGADSSRRMRGAKFSLQDNGGIDDVYLDEPQLAAVRRDLFAIENGIAELKSSTAAPMRAQGTASCWMPARPQRILCPGYVVGPEGSRMTLGAYGAHGFQFPGRRLVELATLIERALDAVSAR